MYQQQRQRCLQWPSALSGSWLHVWSWGWSSSRPIVEIVAASDISRTLSDHSPSSPCISPSPGQASLLWGWGSLDAKAPESSAARRNKQVSIIVRRGVGPCPFQSVELNAVPSGRDTSSNSRWHAFTGIVVIAVVCVRGPRELSKHIWAIAASSRARGLRSGGGSPGRDTASPGDRADLQDPGRALGPTPTGLEPASETSIPESRSRPRSFDATMGSLISTTDAEDSHRIWSTET